VAAKHHYSEILPFTDHDMPVYVIFSHSIDRDGPKTIGIWLREIIRDGKLTGEYVRTSASRNSTHSEFGKEEEFVPTVLYPIQPSSNRFSLSEQWESVLSRKLAHLERLVLG